MQHQSPSLRMSLAVLSLGGILSACTPESSALDLPPGNYQQRTQFTDDSGVTTEHRETTNVGVDPLGHKTAVVQSRTTEKPPGFWDRLFHTRTTEQSTKVMRDDQ